MGLKSLAKLFNFVVCNPCQSSPSLTILVPLWFIIISLVFFHLCNALFSGFLQFKGKFVDHGQNTSKYRDRAPFMILVSHCFFQLAHNSSWHGTPGKHVVYCRHHHVSQGSFPVSEYHVDAASNTAVLQRLDSAKSYNVYIKMCNKEQFCSTGGEQYVVREEQVQGGSSGKYNIT